MGKSLAGGGVGHQEEMMNQKLEEQGECLRREEKNNPGRKNRQVVEILEMKGLVHRKDSHSYQRSQRSSLRWGDKCNLV